MGSQIVLCVVRLVWGTGGSGDGDGGMETGRAPGRESDGAPEGPGVVCVVGLGWRGDVKRGWR